MATDRRAESPNVEGLSAALLDSVTCPISLALVVDPVVAEDGWTYEREAIERWLKDKDVVNSPRTNEPMGPRLLKSGDGRTRVLAAIESGVVDDEAASAWHCATARLQIDGALPGGLASARDHLERSSSFSQSFENEMLLEAFKARERQENLIKSAAAADLEKTTARILDCPLSKESAERARKKVQNLLSAHQRLVVGRRIEVEWDDHGNPKYYSGTIAAYTLEYGHHIQYDNGDLSTYKNLMAKNFRILTGSGDVPSSDIV
mmetsp:Transcript_13302/g.40992  ORF Transcript_13302/g.40992 Transcript_13302/m.40992 type:complete len:262 (-) Transcript_13302:58-843(-)